MKLTWFGGMALRVYLGGAIVVLAPETAPEGVAPAELRSGADHVVSGAEMAGLSLFDATLWRPQPAPRAIDEDRPPAVEFVRIAPSTLLIAAAGEPPVVVMGEGAAPRFGRWADGAVIVMTTMREALLAEVTVLLDVARPRLIALALDDQTLDLAIEEIAEHLAGTGLVSLEPGLALEV